MTVSVSIKKSSEKKTDVAIVAYFEGREPTKDAVKLDKETNGVLDS